MPLLKDQSVLIDSSFKLLLSSLDQSRFIQQIPINFGVDAVLVFVFFKIFNNAEGNPNEG